VTDRVMFYCQMSWDRTPFVRSSRDREEASPRFLMSYWSQVEKVQTGSASRNMTPAASTLKTSPDFSSLPAVGEFYRSLEETRAMRRTLCSGLLCFNHDVLVHRTDSFPEGRHFRFELVPLLESARQASITEDASRSSVEDICRGKEGQESYEQRVCSLVIVFTISFGPRR